MWLYNHFHNDDIEYLHYPKKFFLVHLTNALSSLISWPLETTKQLSITIILFFSIVLHSI